MSGFPSNPLVIKRHPFSYGVPATSPFRALGQLRAAGMAVLKATPSDFKLQTLNST